MIKNNFQDQSALSYKYRIHFYETIYTNHDFMNDLCATLMQLIPNRGASVRHESRSITLHISENDQTANPEKYIEEIPNALTAAYNNYRELISNSLKGTGLFGIEELYTVVKYMYSLNILKDAIIIQL